MNRLAAALSCLVVLAPLLVSGCAQPPAGPTEYAAAVSPPVCAAIESSGGAQRWRQLGPVRATAVVALYDEKGTAWVTQQKQVIDLFNGRIRASARLPRGTWTAQVGEGADPAFHVEGEPSSQVVRQRVLDGLWMTLHRVRGPLNLCYFGEQAGPARRVKIDGQELIRVPVVQSRHGARAYYFDPHSSMLRLMTAGSDEPGQGGTVTVFTYAMQRGGLAFPSRIEVRRIGQHQLIGDARVMTVDYTDVDL